jgi:hypothetical protein
MIISKTVTDYQNLFFRRFGGKRNFKDKRKNFKSQKKWPKVLEISI